MLGRGWGEAVWRGTVHQHHDTAGHVSILKQILAYRAIRRPSEHQIMLKTDSRVEIPADTTSVRLKT